MYSEGNMDSKSICNKCHLLTGKSDFGYRGKVCSSCRSEYHLKYYRDNKSHINSDVNSRNDEIRDAIFNLLGCVCVGCGEMERDFLTVDHVNNNRKSERSKNSLVWKRDIINGVVERSNYQILCRNCNESKQRLNPINLQKVRIPTGIYKKCSTCDLEKDVCEFSTSSHRGKKCLDSACHICVKFNCIAITIKCYAILGGQCICCGISDPSKINIDHKHDDGGSRRKSGEYTGVTLCRQILNGKVDFNLYQLLCANCNYSKMRHGSCIHNKSRSS